MIHEFQATKLRAHFCVSDWSLFSCIIFFFQSYQRKARRHRSHDPSWGHMTIRIPVHCWTINACCRSCSLKWSKICHIIFIFPYFLDAYPWESIFCLCIITEDYFPIYSCINKFWILLQWYVREFHACVSHSAWNPRNKSLLKFWRLNINVCMCVQCTSILCVPIPFIGDWIKENE